MKWVNFVSSLIFSCLKMLMTKSPRCFFICKIYYDTFFLFLPLVIEQDYVYIPIYNGVFTATKISFIHFFWFHQFRFLLFRQFVILTVSYSQPVFAVNRIIWLLQHPTNEHCNLAISFFDTIMGYYRHKTRSQ